MGICRTSFWYFLLNMAYAYLLTQEGSKYPISIQSVVTDKSGLKSIIYYEKKTKFKKWFVFAPTRRRVSVVDIKATKK